MNALRVLLVAGVLVAHGCDAAEAQSETHYVSTTGRYKIFLHGDTVWVKSDSRALRYVERADSIWVTTNYGSERAFTVKWTISGASAAATMSGRTMTQSAASLTNFRKMALNAHRMKRKDKAP